MYRFYSANLGRSPKSNEGCPVSGSISFKIESSTFYTLKAHAEKLNTISKERIRDELIKLITETIALTACNPCVTGLMNYIIPELMAGMGIMHYNKPLDVLEHNLVACKVIRNTLPLGLLLCSTMLENLTLP